GMERRRDAGGAQAVPLPLVARVDRGCMPATRSQDESALARIRRDFPLWESAYDPGRPDGQQGRAWRRDPLTLVEVDGFCKRTVYGGTRAEFLARLGAELRAQDILRASSQ